MVGEAYQRAGKLTEAAETLNKAIAAHPSRADLHLALGRVYKQMGKHRLAREAFLEAYRLAPEPVTAFEAAMACLKLVDEPLSQEEQHGLGEKSPLGLAFDLLQQAITRDPGYAPAWMGLGQAQWRLGRHEDAVKSLEQALVIDPQLAEAHSFLGQCWLARGERDKARQALSKAVELDPNLPEAGRLAGDMAYEAGDYVGAATCYQRLDASQLTEVALVDRVARCYLEVGQPGKSVELLAGRSAYEPDTRLTLARGLARLGRWKEALETLLAIDPKTGTPEYRYYLATALAANGRLDDAERLLNVLSQDQVWRSRATRQLGHIRLLKGDFASAEMLYISNDGSAASAFVLGRLCLLRQDSQAARGHFQQAIARNGKAGLARLGLAIANAQLGEAEPLSGLLDDPELSTFASEQLGHQAYDSGQYVDALACYERALKQRDTVSTRVLCRMTVAYLQLGRYREALPHLVELSRRRPKITAVWFNLAVCRYHLGRAHFKQSQWEMARLEWSRARDSIKTSAPVQAAALQNWELEAAFREGSRLLTKFADKPPELKRAVRLFEYGCERAPHEPRWPFGAGLAHALIGDYARSAEFFARAWKLAPDRVNFTLACGLSLEADNRGEHARAALHKALEMAESSGDQARSGIVPLATRFALAMSYAKERQWEKAARELEPLLEHPLICSSSRIKPSDVAQAMVAYYGLAGQKEKAGQLAQKYLQQAGGIGSLMLGIVQADSGDYEGAADTLSQAYAQDPKPEVRKILVSCLLAAAAAHVLKGDAKAATECIKRALKHDSANSVARQLDNTLVFATQLKNLDFSQLDSAIQRCEAMLQSGGQSSQVLRTLGLLHHRKALDAERRNRSVDEAWRNCVSFWRTRILRNDAFWTAYTAEYNTGRGKREQVKPDELTKWRSELPTEFAGDHAALVGVCLRSSDKVGLKRHISLIWDWAPDFTLPEGFLLADLGQIDDAMIDVFEAVVDSVKAPELRKTLGAIAAGRWNDKGVTAGNRADKLKVEAVSLANATVELVIKLGPIAAHVPGLLDQAKSALQHARSTLQDARRHAEEARRYVAKAHKLAPDAEKIKNNRDVIEALYRNIDENLDTINNFCRQIGA